MTSGKDNDAPVTALPARAAEIANTLGEIASASGYVVAKRLSLMGAAIANPLDANYRELGRMVPEKIFAASHSGIALLAGFNAFQRDLAAHATEWTNLLLSGVPSAANLADWADASGKRGSRALMWPIVTGAAAIAPLHKAVMLNVRRLGEGEGVRRAA